MFGRFRQVKVRPDFQASVDEDLRVYAIGDIHGRLDLLNELFDKISDDHAARGPADVRLILLGDLVDRGIESAQVVERVRLIAEADTRVSCLFGNHEEVFLSALSGHRESLRLFTRIGGRETLLSYGMTSDEYHSLLDDELLARMIELVPEEHIGFLESLPRSMEIGDYLFVHAGVRPNVALDAQTSSDLRWIREPFLSYEGDFGKMIIHGHTVTPEVDMRSNRIGIDTGAVHGGRLTAIGLEGTCRWFLATEPHETASADLAATAPTSN